MTTDNTNPTATEAVRTGVESGLALSVWDALMVGRVCANRPGLRGRPSDAAPNPDLPVTKHKETA